MIVHGCLKDMVIELLLLFVLLFLPHWLWSFYLFLCTVSLLAIRLPCFNKLELSWVEFHRLVAQLTVLMQCNVPYRQKAVITQMWSNEELCLRPRPAVVDWHQQQVAAEQCRDDPDEMLLAVRTCLSSSHPPAQIQHTNMQLLTSPKALDCWDF